MLEFLKLHPDIELYDIYVDDGWSGTNFDRPDFTRMMEDVYSGNVNCVIVKDLSRFGRNYTDSGNYLDNVFVRLRIRFIALNNGVDTASNNMNAATQCISVGVTNVINESVAATTSVKDRDYNHGGANHEFPHEHEWKNGVRGPAQPVPSEFSWGAALLGGLITIVELAGYYYGAPIDIPGN